MVLYCAVSSVSRGNYFLHWDKTSLYSFSGSILVLPWNITRPIDRVTFTLCITLSKDLPLPYCGNIISYYFIHPQIHKIFKQYLYIFVLLLTGRETKKSVNIIALVVNCSPLSPTHGSLGHGECQPMDMLSIPDIS